MGTSVGYKIDGIDIGAGLVDRSYLIDRYPDLVDTFKMAGLWLWGINALGQLGDSTVDSRSSPVQTISGGSNWKDISFGEYHIGALKTDGTLWTWGENISGQLGDNTTTSRSSPVQTISAGSTWRSISCGGARFTAATKTDGSLWLWGNNGNGQLGDNSQTTRISPVQTSHGGTDWKHVSAGGYHTSAIKLNGELWSWGSNAYGQLGNNASVDKSTPVQTVSGTGNWRQVSCGEYHTAAIKTDGTLWLWGDNTGGKLGDNTTTSRSSPVQTISGGTTWKQVSCGDYHTAAIKNDGTLWIWGDNTTGRLGDGTTVNKSSPVQTVSGSTMWKQISCGNNSAAIKTDGTLWLWGLNSSGQLGDNTVTSRSSPVQTVSGGTNWKLVSCGSYYTAAAIRDSSSDVFGDPV